MMRFKFDPSNETAYFVPIRIKPSPEKFGWSFSMKYFFSDKFRCSGLQLSLKVVITFLFYYVAFDQLHAQDLFEVLCIFAF